jgi:hypothetical protein
MRPVQVVCFSAFAIAALLSAALLPSAMGVIYTSGLKHGDVAWYSRTGTGAYVGAAPLLRVSVLNVTGASIVYANFTNYFSNGSVNSTIFWQDFLQGNTNARNLLFVTGTGLKVGDQVYGTDTWTGVNILQVQSMKCGGVQRNADLASWNAGFAQGVRVYWDQSTGLMCDFYLQDSGGVQHLTMSNTTLWSSSSPPPQDAFFTAFEITSFLGAPLVILVTFVFIRKRRRLRR